MDKAAVRGSGDGFVVDLWNGTTARTGHLAQTTKIVVVRVYNLAVATLLYTASVATFFQFASLNEKYEVFLWEGRNSGDLRAHAWGVLSPNAAEVILEGKEDEVNKDEPVDNKSDSKKDQDVTSNWLGSVKKGAAWVAASSAMTYVALNCIQFNGIFAAPEVNILPSVLGGVESSSSYLYPALLAGVPAAIVGYRAIQKIRECNIRDNAVRAVDGVWNTMSTSVCSTAVSVAKCTTIAGAALWAANSLPVVHWGIADSWWGFALETAVTAAFVPTVKNYSSKVLKTITSVLDPTKIAGASLVSALGLSILYSLPGPHLVVANSWNWFAVQSAVVGTAGLAAWAYTKPVETVKKHTYNFSVDCLTIGLVAFAALETLTYLGLGSHMNSFWWAAEAAVPLTLACKLHSYWKNKGVQAKKVAEQVALNNLQAQVLGKALKQLKTDPEKMHKFLTSDKPNDEAIKKARDKLTKKSDEIVEAQPNPTVQAIDAAQKKAESAVADLKLLATQKNSNSETKKAANKVRNTKDLPTLVAALVAFDDEADKDKVIRDILS